MTVLAIIIFILIIAFGSVVLVGAPYVPTLKPQVEAALDLLDLNAGQTMLELGSGDGKVLVAAAERGWNAVGYELNPLLVIVSRLRTLRYGKRVKVVWCNYWLKQWQPADGIFTFLLPKLMPKLDTKIQRYPHKPVKLASFAFAIPAKKASRTKQGVYLYLYH